MTTAWYFMPPPLFRFLIALPTSLLLLSACEGLPPPGPAGYQDYQPQRFFSPMIEVRPALPATGSPPEAAPELTQPPRTPPATKPLLPKPQFQRRWA